MAIGTPQIGLYSSSYRNLTFTAAQAARFNAGVRPERGTAPPRCAKRRRPSSNQLTFLIGRIVR